MAGDKTKTGKGDRDRINVDEEYELRNWAERVGVSPERLAPGREDVLPDGEGYRGGSARSSGPIKRLYSQRKTGDC
jgi:hypothetical protein